MIIKKNTHYARPLQLLKKLLGIHICKSRKMSCEVSFTESCRYNVGKDQSDINKLFGFSIGMHHKNSVRVGWRYVPSADLIEIVSYVYRNGERLQEQNIDFVQFNNKVNYTIELRNDGAVYFCAGKRWRVGEFIRTKGRFFLSYPLSLYFGGNCYAPHDMNINYKVYYNGY